MSVIIENEKNALLEDYIEIYGSDLSSQVRLGTILDDNTHRTIRLKARGLIVAASVKEKVNPNPNKLAWTF